MSTDLEITHGSIDSLVDGPGGMAYSLNGLHVRDGGNYLALARNPVLFGQEQLSISIAFKAETPNVGGGLFRIHNALQIDVTNDGQVVFNLIENSVGESGVIASTGLAVTDGQWHYLTLTYDSIAGVMIGYVDGSAVGEIAVSGATKIAEYWDPMIGNPWGTGFAGLVDDIEFQGTALSAEQVGQKYDSFIGQLIPAESVQAAEPLFQLDFDSGELVNTSGTGTSITAGTVASITDGAYNLNGLHVRDGGNYIAIERDPSLFSKQQMSVSLDFKTAEPGVGGGLFRIHNALQIDVTNDGQVVFTLHENSVGESGVVKTAGLSVTDGEWHRATLTYDAVDGKMTGYVDGAAAGAFAVSGPTKAAEYWNPMIGNPWGKGVTGFVDNIEIHEGVVVPPAIAEVSEDIPINHSPTVAGGTFSILETSAEGTVVGSVAADDLDGDTITYSIISGNDGATFRIETDGQIVVNDPTLIPLESQSTLELTVEVTDSHGASATAEVHISITSLDALLATAQDSYAIPILVNDSAGLAAALRNATGGETILLRPDVAYAGVVKTADPAATVTVTSLDPQSPATITGLDLSSVSNVTFDNLRFEFIGTPNQHQMDIKISDSDNIRFTDSVFKGTAEGYVVEGEPTAQSMIRVLDSSNFTFDNNIVSHYLHGVSVHRAQGISIHDNELYGLQGDGMHFSQVQDITIENNYFHDFLGSDAGVTHNDYVQFWTTNTTAPSVGITIRGNVIISGDFQSQAIFFRDQLGDTGQGEMRYQDVRIEENVIYNDNIHGITTANTDGLVIRGNSLLLHPADGASSAINVVNSTGVEVYDNVAPRISVGADNAVLRLDDNVLLQDVYASQPNYVGDLFVNPMQGTGAHIEDLYVHPEGGLVRSDDTVIGSEQLKMPSNPEGLNAVAVAESARTQGGMNFTFDARYTADKAGLLGENDARFLWDFGDGEADDGARVSHVYDKAGEYQVVLSVLSNDGASDTARIRAVVDKPLDAALDFNDGALQFHDQSSGDVWTS